MSAWSEKNNFKSVQEFMETMGQDCPTTPTHPEKIPETSNLRLKLIEEEVQELREAIQTNNFVEVVDALADILYVTYGAGVAWGVDLQKAFELVHTSNMTKMCFTEDEAKETCQWYRDRPEKGYPSPIYEKNGLYFVVREQSTGKVLKSINYKPVDLKALT
tara:strand:- start:486 stop:968 length:483 start_codon:yes stop_codon:yes gene_type:complete